LERTGQKVKEDKSKEHVEERAYIHTEDVGRKEDQTTAYDTSSKISDVDDGISVLDGYISNESTPEEDAGPYDDLFQSADVGDPTSFNMHDTYDEGSSRRIAPTHDEDSTPYLIYDVDDDEDMIVP
jgi:hypothetical protein